MVIQMVTPSPVTHKNVGRGSLEKVTLERAVRESGEDEAQFPVYRRFIMERFRERQIRKEEEYSRENWPVRQLR